jgi:predicted phage tail protein
MKTIKLFGDLEIFKSVWVLDVVTPSEALRAISVQREGFLTACDEGKYIAVLVDPENPETSARQVVLTNALMPWGEEELWVLPTLSGEGGLVVAAVFGAAFAATTAGIVVATVINIALAIAISAIANLITGKKQKTTATNQEAPNNKPSFISDGPVNLTQAGHTHPIIAGHSRHTGSLVLSSNYWVEDLP